LHLKKDKKIFTVIIVPHADDSVFSFRISVFPLQILCLCLVGIMVFSFTVLSNYRGAEAKLIRLAEVEIENNTLKEDMDRLTLETEEIKLQLLQVSALSKEIAEIAEISDTAVFLQSSEESLLYDSRYGEVRLLSSRDGVDVLDRVNMNISLLRESIPQQKEELTQLKDDIKEHQKELAHLPSIWPTKGRISSVFGPRRSPISGRLEMHNGLDIAAPRGTPIYATANGKITEAGYNGGYGNVITIDHGYSYKTRYAHLSSFAIEKGDQMQKGDIIGYMGSTGRSTSSHLHYEVLKDGVAINPRDFLTK